MKRKLKRFAYRFVKCEGVTAVIAAVIVACVFTSQKLFGGEQIEIMDWTIFSSMVAAMVVGSLAGGINRILMNKLEDELKLTTDYKKLASKYVNKMICYDNSGAAAENLQCIPKGQGYEVRIPAICEYILGQCELEIIDRKEFYEKPEIIQEHFDELFAAHGTSQVYNQLNIRIDDWWMENDRFVMRTSRTTYFDSLVTNRAMDFRWTNGMSVRELFEYGPFMHELRESSLSNHLGFNGFVESADGYIVFVKRGNKLSIGKGTYGDSIGASLKTKYALNASGEFTEQGLEQGILREIKDELKIPAEALESFSCSKNVITAYRDVVEGGKPQLLFYVRVRQTREQIEQNFRAECAKEGKEIRKDILEDGEKFLWVERTELNRICVLPDRIIYHGKPYYMMPSAAASVVMLINYLRKVSQN